MRMHLKLRRILQELYPDTFEEIYDRICTYRKHPVESTNHLSAAYLIMHMKNWQLSQEGRDYWRGIYNNVKLHEAAMAPTKRNIKSAKYIHELYGGLI